MTDVKKDIEKTRAVRMTKLYTDWRERFFHWLAWRLPRRLIYWAAIRLVTVVTSGYWARTIVPELTFTDALTRWEKGPRGAP